MRLGVIQTVRIKNVGQFTLKTSMSGYMNIFTDVIQMILDESRHKQILGKLTDMTRELRHGKW